ncbi:MAG: hypothetical protein ABSC46_02410 [Candidatus Limnocylindrales bacterium]|jgi:hypothetical protein
MFRRHAQPAPTPHPFIAATIPARLRLDNRHVGPVEPAAEEESRKCLECGRLQDDPIHHHADDKELDWG